MENQIVLSMTNVLTVLGGFVAIFGWFYMLMSRKFDVVDRRFNESDKRIDKRFDAVDKKFDKLDADIKELRGTLTAFEKNTEHRLTVIEVEAKNTNQRLSTIEGYLVPKKVFRFEEPHEEEHPKEN